MIRSIDNARASEIRHSLIEFQNTVHPLVGITDQIDREVFVAQLIESERRQKYISKLIVRTPDGTNIHPHSNGFCPLNSAIFHLNTDNFDEACWVTFLSTHFGRNKKTKWGLCRGFYGKLGTAPNWSWVEVIRNTNLVRPWVENNQDALREFGWGNHRKHEHVAPENAKGIADVIESYVGVFGDSGHNQIFAETLQGLNHPSERFEKLYQLFKKVTRIGRLGAFDHVMMLSKIGIVDSNPSTPYLSGATGPKVGASLLLTGEKNSKIDIAAAEATLMRFANLIDVDGQVIEDAMCNWQKSPNLFKPFR